MNIKNIFLLFLFLIPLFSFSQIATFEQLYSFVQMNRFSCVQNYGQGFLVAGGGGGTNGNHSYLLQTDSLGNQINLRDTSSSFYSYCDYVSTTSDGGYIICEGLSDAQPQSLYFEKYDSNNSRQWTTRFSPSPITDINSIIQTQDGGYVAIGNKSYPVNGFLLLKMNANGDSLWSHNLATNYSYATGSSVQEMSDGKLLMSLKNDAGELVLMKTLADGTNPVQYNFPGLLSASHNPFVQLNNGNIAVIGTSQVNNVTGLAFDIANSNGAILDSRFFYLPTGDTLPDVIKITMTPDSEFMIGSNDFNILSGEKLWLLKLSLHGDFLWQKTMEVASISGYSDDYLNDINTTPDGGFIIAGHSFLTDTVNYSNVFENAFLVKTDSFDDVLPPSPPRYYDQPVTIFPNPAKDDFSVVVNGVTADAWLFIEDLSGRRVMQVPISPPAANGNSTTRLSCRDLKSGIYICYVMDENKKINAGKLVVH